LIDEHQQRTLEHFAANVTSHRLAANLTQGQFAELIGLDVRMVRMLEAASSPPSFASVCRIAEALGVEVSDLFVPALRPNVSSGRPKKLKP
jgi:transcriptional regulator with XRE-family HTH domain